MQITIITTPLHIIPKLVLSITTLIGIILSFKLKLNTINFITFYYFANAGLFSIFFIYQDIVYLCLYFS